MLTIITAPVSPSPPHTRPEMLLPTAATQRSLCWKPGGGEAVALFGGWLPLAETLERVAIPAEGVVVGGIDF